MNEKTKLNHLEQLRQYKQQLYRNPVLKYLFLELTLRCNEHCRHCGSRCGDVRTNEMTKEQYFSFLEKIKADFPQLPMLCITGGEPLLREDFFEIMDYAKKLGYMWGMTSNGTLITPHIAQKLEKVGMKTISVSIDGLEQTHDDFRQSKGGFRKSISGIKNLLAHDFKAVQVTTVVTKKNIAELEQLCALMCELDVDSWRVINIEPIGRALTLDGYTLDKEDYRYLFSFIRQKRLKGYPVTYGCQHYLGTDYEKEVRDWYFLCNAGIYVASVMANGDIGACLDIERRKETIQGNIFKDDFTQVWYNRFQIFRTPLAEKNTECANCLSRPFCDGGAYHSWDYDTNKPLVCFKNILFC